MTKQTFRNREISIEQLRRDYDKFRLRLEKKRSLSKA